MDVQEVLGAFSTTMISWLVLCALCLREQLRWEWLPVLRSNPFDINKTLLQLAWGGLPLSTWETLHLNVRDVLEHAVTVTSDRVHLSAPHYTLFFKVSLGGVEWERKGRVGLGTWKVAGHGDEL
jgi:hypothetical protein